MNNKIFLALLLALVCIGCEKTVIAYPGNTQDTDPKAPEGGINWLIAAGENGKGQLPENSASNLSIGVLNATDPNPDDEVFYSLDKQTIDGQDVNFFKIVVEDSTGIANLKTNTNDINFEAIGGSKEVELTIKATDDSPAAQSSDFLVTVQIVDVNETPYYTNINEVVRYADENIEYNFNKVEWTDTDEGQNPTLTHSGPGWLNISSEGQMTGTPETGDIGNNSFVLTISDGAIDVQEEVNIEVRENLAPEFTNIGSIPTSIRVGCYDDNDNIVDLNWIDPNNSAPHFNGSDLITFTHQGTGSIEWLNFDNDDNGKLFCVRAPENSDAGTASITIKVEDNRPSNPKSSEYSFDLELIANDAPQFSNLGNFPNTMSSGDTLTFDVEWQDPNSDVISFSVSENFSWFEWDNSGNITAIPTSSHVGSWDIPFNINDGCYTSTTIKTLTVE